MLLKKNKKINESLPGGCKKLNVHMLIPGNNIEAED